MPDTENRPTPLWKHDQLRKEFEEHKLKSAADLEEFEDWTKQMFAKLEERLSGPWKWFKRVAGGAIVTTAVAQIINWYLNI